MIGRHRIRAAARSALLSAVIAGAACQPRDRAAATVALRSRTILVLLDLSGSMVPGRMDGPLRRLAAEARPTDRLVILPLTDRTSEPPVLDTVIPGGTFGQLSRTLGVATRESSRRAQAQQAAFSEQLQQLTRTAYQRGPSRGTGIVDALCEAATTATARPTEQVIVLVLTDGLESSPWGSLESRSPTVNSARRLAERVRATRPCALDATNLRVRMNGLRHPIDTPALVRWWAAFVTVLGYRMRAEDVSAHPLGPLLGRAAVDAGSVRDPGPGPTRSRAVRSNARSRA